MLNDACLLVHAVELTSGRNSQEHNRSTSWYADKWQGSGYSKFVLSQFVFARFPTTPTRSYTSCQCVVEISLDLSMHLRFRITEPTSDDVGDSTLANLRKSQLWVKDCYLDCHGAGPND